LLVVFPTDPGWVPNSQQANLAAEVIARLTAASGDQLELSRTDNIEFIDAGENFEAIRCPLCGHELDVDWWQDHVSGQYSAESGFRLEPFVAQCCRGHDDARRARLRVAAGIRPLDGCRLESGLRLAYRR
jgi:hypothetical protein